MISEVTLEFPEFITHIPQTKNKWIKIGYNKIYTGGHFSMRNALVAAMHGYIEKHIPPNLDIKVPVETHLTIYAPINFGNVKRLKNKTTGKYYISWKPARDSYVPNWDIGNLAMVWLKCLDDVLIKKKLIPDDTVEYLVKTTYEFVEIKDLKDRKLVYKIKNVK
jgi:hypothetical protein